jgi:hypothetical protein
MPGYYKITGRIRSEDNKTVEGYTVQAFDKDPGIYLHPDDRLGKAITNGEGSFEITFTDEAFKDWLEGNPEVYLVIRDKEGRILITTQSKENVTGEVDFQIKLGRPSPNPLEPDLYANNLERMIAALRNIGDAADLSRSDVMTIYELLLRIAGSWAIYRDELVRLYGYNGIQVPKYPRKEGHDHITRWDKAVLPV